MSNLFNVVSLLSREYKDPQLSNFIDPIDEIVFILLSEKTDEAKYKAAYKNLKAHFPTWTHALSATQRQIKAAIEVAGMGNRRADLLIRLLRAIVKKFGALDLSKLASLSSEEAETELIQLPGIGRKTARCVLLYCFGVPVLPVDIHTYRLAIRLGIISRSVSYERSHNELPLFVPATLRRRFHVNAVAHGRARCFAHDPNCKNCPLRDYCSHPKAIKPLPISVRPEAIAVDLFAGGGGLSLGFKNGGFRIVQAVECSSKAAATYTHNNPDVDLIERDIRKIDPHAALARLGLRSRDVTALIGGIPCQGFSESNRRTRSSSNPSNHLYKRFIRFLEIMQPEWFVLENVAGVRTMERGLILHRIIGECKAAGYEVDWRELNAVDFGVPQIRRRIFIIGNRLGLPITFPMPTHGRGLKPPVTVRQALSDLPTLKNGASDDRRRYRKNGKYLRAYQRLMRTLMNGNGEVQGNLVTRSAEIIIKRYRHIGAGGNWEKIPSELMANYEDVSRCHTGIYHRLAWDKPSKVIGNFRKNMLIHPQQHRGLSVREAARLQSFPDHYEFLDSIGFQQQQVADAVPPLLAEAVARCILKVRK
jgi:DNA (cytosine-5)-methyltransferase 1